MSFVSVRLPTFSLYVSVSVLAPQLTLTPAQQQMLLQQAQAQLLAAAVQHSASQQNSTTGASISASAAAPMSQLPMSQPIQIASVRSTRPVFPLLQILHAYFTYKTQRPWKVLNEADCLVSQIRF